MKKIVLCGGGASHDGVYDDPNDVRDYDAYDHGGPTKLNLDTITYIKLKVFLYIILYCYIRRIIRL